MTANQDQREPGNGLELPYSQNAVSVRRVIGVRRYDRIERFSPTRLTLAIMPGPDRKLLAMLVLQHRDGLDLGRVEAFSGLLVQHRIG